MKRRRGRAEQPELVAERRRRGMAVSCLSSRLGHLQAIDPWSPALLTLGGCDRTGRKWL